MLPFAHRFPLLSIPEWMLDTFLRTVEIIINDFFVVVIQRGIEIVSFYLDA